MPPMLGRYSLPARDIAGDIAPPSKNYVFKTLTIGTDSRCGSTPAMWTVWVVGWRVVLHRCLAAVVNSA